MNIEGLDVTIAEQNEVHHRKKCARLRHKSEVLRLRRCALVRISSKMCYSFSYRTVLVTVVFVSVSVSVSANNTGRHLVTV